MDKGKRIVDIYVKVTSESRKKLFLSLFKDRSSHPLQSTCISYKLHPRNWEGWTRWECFKCISAKEFGVQKAKLSNAANHDEFNELEDMQSYCHNTELCRRFLLLKHFDGTDKAYEERLTIPPKHKYCDIRLNVQTWRLVTFLRALHFLQIHNN